MLNTTLSRPYTYVGPLTYSEPKHVTGTGYRVRRPQSRLHRTPPRG
jgi:hypothetical protein